MRYAFGNKLLFLAAVLAALALTTGTVLAHERRDVDKYQFRTGWLNEPAFEGVQNAVFLAVTDRKKNAPVEELEKTLQVEVTHVPSKKARTFSLEDLHGRPGEYVANVFPTAPGHYRLRFFGTVEGTQINETFNSRSGGGGFDDVEAQEELQFPEKVRAAGELEGVVRGAQNTAQQAQDKASSARTLAVVGIVLGAIGIASAAGSAIVALRRR